MKYLTKQYFHDLHIITFIFLIILQVFGCSSLWGYSEILGFRKGYQFKYAILVLTALSLSLLRIGLLNSSLLLSFSIKSFSFNSSSPSPSPSPSTISYQSSSFSIFSFLFKRPSSHSPSLHSSSPSPSPSSVSSKHSFSSSFSQNYSSKNIYINSIHSPYEGLRQFLLQLKNKKTFNLLLFLCLLFTFILDFILQILGTASIWAYSEIIGKRTTPAQCEKWGKITIFFSFLSLVRYIMKFRRNFYELDNYNNFKLPIEFWEYFEIGFVSIFINKKKVLNVILLTNNWELNRSMGKSTLIATNESIDQVDQDIIETKSKINYFCIAAFLLGYFFHLILSFILEWLGSGGAIWGFSEVVTLRKTPTSLKFRILAVITSCSVSINSIKDYISKIYHTNQAEKIEQNLEMINSQIKMGNRFITNSNPEEETGLTTQNPLNSF